MRLFILLFLTVVFLNGDEVKRIHDIVSHMTQLKSSYEECKGELKKYKVMYEEEKQKNKELKLEKQKIQNFKKPDITIEKFDPSSFRLKADSDIYDKVNGTIIQKWEKGTSFTSNVKAGKWIKITGYFVDRKWRSATKPMWIEAKNTFKRD